MRRVTGAGLAEGAANLALAVLFLWFAWANLMSFVELRRPSTALVVVLEAIFAGLFLVRTSAESTSFSAWAFVTTTGGTFLPLLLRPTAATSDAWVGQGLQVAGTALAIYGVLSLNRSFGLLPAKRAIKRDGMFRWVRHPLYSAYAVASIGYVVSHPTLANVIVVLAHVAFQVARIGNEERLLSRYPEYAEYKTRTRWRLVPFVF